MNWRGLARRGYASVMGKGIAGNGMEQRVIRLRWDWAAVALLFLADGILLLTTNFKLVPRPELLILAAAGFLRALALIYSSVRDAPRLANMAAVGGLLVLFTNATAVLNYILNGIAVFPLWDARFDAADAAAGLRWLVFYHWMHLRHGFFLFNAAVYAALGPEVIFLVVWLETCGRHARAVSFWRQFAAGAFITVIIGVLLPAAGPFVFYHLPVAAQTGYVAQMAALRDGALRVIDLNHVEGLVVFPSFHTTLALLCAYAARGFRYLFAPLLLLNLAIIFSAPVIGGHYFVDIIAGAVLAAGVIAAERGIRPR